MNPIRLSLPLLTLWLLLALTGPVAADIETRGGTIWYVNHAADGDDDGTSWEDAFNDLIFALDAAESGDEIWVAAGTYSPANANAEFGIWPPRFLLPAGVALYGGFDGSEDEREQRDWLANPTILTGDIGGGDNTGTVVGVEKATAGTRVDGFTITDGDGGNGAGISLASGDGMVIENVDLIGNTSPDKGGAVFLNNASPILRNVRVIDNQAGFQGGGIFLQGSASQPTLIDVTFQGNSAPNNGGAIYSEGNGFTGINVRFLGNESSGGGAITCNNCSIEIANGLFVNNVGSFRGGALENIVGGEVTLTNVTAWGNEADGSGQASAIGGGAQTIINNSIFWGHGDNAIENFNNTVTASHSLFEGENPAGDGNLDGTDPDNTPLVVRLPDSDEDDFGNLRMVEGSPTIGQGSNDLLPADEFDIDGDGNTTEPLPLDLDGNSRVIGVAVDLGAFEYDELLDLIFRNRFQAGND